MYWSVDDRGHWRAKFQGLTIVVYPTKKFGWQLWVGWTRCQGSWDRSFEVRALFGRSLDVVEGK